MKKQIMLLYACAMGAGFFLLNACVKPPPNFDPRDGNNVYTGCRIKSINGIPVAYNRNNDPVSFIGNGPAYTGNPNLYFKYDNKGRLIEYVGLYSNGSYDNLHRYGYTHDLITTDTVFVFGTYGVPNSYVFKRILYPQYDNLNRVIEDSPVPDPDAATIANGITYFYDDAGNLRNGGNVYDNKLNPNRTNKIWMFIERDYSVNNPAMATKYNSIGLPLSFPSKNPLNMRFGPFYYNTALDIVYDCR